MSIPLDPEPVDGYFPPGELLPYYYNGDFELKGSGWKRSVYLASPSFPLSDPVWSFNNYYALLDFDFKNGGAIVPTGELRQDFRYDETKHYVMFYARVMVDATGKMPEGATLIQKPQITITAKLLTSQGQEYVLGEFFYDEDAGWRDLCSIRVAPYFTQNGNYALVLTVKIRAGQCLNHGVNEYFGAKVAVDDLLFGSAEGVGKTENLSIGENLIVRFKMSVTDSMDIGENSPTNIKIMRDESVLRDEYDVSVVMWKLDSSHSKNPAFVNVSDASKFHVIYHTGEEVIQDESLEINKVKLVRDRLSLSGFLIVKWKSGNKVNLLGVPDEFPVLWKPVSPVSTNWNDLILGYHE